MHLCIVVHILTLVVGWYDSHIEGDFTSRRLEALPDGMFNNWPHLSFLHLGTIINVTSIPSLDKLHNLRYLSLVGLHHVQDLPSLDSLHALQRIQLVDAAHISSLPSIALFKHLQLFVIRYRAAMCCNGFLTNECDLAHFSCYPRSGEPIVTCTDARISMDDRERLKLLGPPACPPNMTTDVSLLAPTEHTTDELCGHIMYRQCSHGGKPGICFNARMQVISCVVAPGYIDMRRLQIARRVGDRCDPAVEAWLGCV